MLLCLLITANVAALIKMGLRDRPCETPATCFIKQGAKSGLLLLRKDLRRKMRATSLELNGPHADEECQMVSSMGRMVMR